RTARVYRADGSEALLSANETLDGADVLPGFRCPLADLWCTSLNRELGREDSNLQLPKSRGRRAAHRPKARKKLTDARDAKQAPPERKPDPETVTKPSSGSAPRRRT